MKHIKYLFIVPIIFLYSFSAFPRTVIISDIDDTIKKSNSMGKPLEQVFHFLQKKPYLVMRDLFKEIKLEARKRNDTINFYYVSAAYSVTFKADKWIDKHEFPQGRTVLRDIKRKTPIYNFKRDVIKAILEQESKNLDIESNEELIVYMFGDNAQLDPQIYSEISKVLKLNHSNIYIRDVKADATEFDSSLPINKIDGINYFFSEVEFLNYSEFEFISPNLRSKIHNEYLGRNLIPQYTLKTLERRLYQFASDRQSAKKSALDYWIDYYNRF